MTTDPLVSVIMPTRDRWPLVLESIDSVLLQDDPRWELILVDDGSTDGTADHLEGDERTSAREGSPVDSRIRVIRQEPRGRSAARNRGVAEARAPVLAFLDSDDLYLPWHIGQFLQATPASGSVYAADHLLWDPVSGHRERTVLPRFYPEDPRVSALVGTIATLPGLFAPKGLIESVGGFREDLDGSEDWDLLVRLLRAAPLCRLARPSVLVRQHPGRRSQDVDWDLEWRRRAANELLADPRVDLGPGERALVLAGVARYGAARHYECGEIGLVRRDLVEVLRRLPWVSGWRWVWRLWLQSYLSSRARGWVSHLGRAAQRR